MYDTYPKEGMKMNSIDLRYSVVADTCRQT